MIEEVDIKESLSLEDYLTIPHLTTYVHDLQIEAKTLLPNLKGRTTWMVNSTAQGGGVAEMMPKLVRLLRQLGLDINWAVINTDKIPFFDLTKGLHNMIHGVDKGAISADQREVFEEVNRENAVGLEKMMKNGDILAVHDPQPIALNHFIRKNLDIKSVWRCHIGLDDQNNGTQTAWNFLKPYAEEYDMAVFTAPEYIPSYLAGKSTIITPALDPLSHKNRDLVPHKLTGILCNSGMIQEHNPVLTPAFDNQAMRLQADGTFAVATIPDETGLLYRPIITQISRWDRLKGFKPLLDAFVHLKKNKNKKATDERDLRRLELVRFIMAGPDPASIQDDPEGKEVLQELCDTYTKLPADIQKDVILLTLPMNSAKENALMVNALQRCSTIVVQNSIQEGFGLTCTEPMLKGRAVLVSNACGLRQQVRDSIDGKMINDANNIEEIADALNVMLADPKKRENWGLNAQRRVLEEFLIFTQAKKWLRTLSNLVTD